MLVPHLLQMMHSLFWDKAGAYNKQLQRHTLLIRNSDNNDSTRQEHGRHAHL